MGNQMPETVLVETSLSVVVFAGGEGFEAQGKAYQKGITETDTTADARRDA
jgi:hypothetical protein